MSSPRRFAIKSALVLAVVTGISLGAWATISVPPPWPPPPPPPSGECPYCYNVDITNTTPNAANDLHVTLQGPTKICQHYLGDYNKFGMPTEQHSASTITLTYASSTQWVQPGDVSHIGFCTNSPVTGMVDGENGGLPPFYWTRQRVFTGPIVAVGHAWQAVRADIGIVPVVTLINTSSTDLHIRQIDWAVVAAPIALNDLMWDGLAQSVEWQPLQKDTFLKAGTSAAPSFVQAALPTGFQPDDPRQIVFRFWAEDPRNPQNMNRGLGQVSVSQLNTLAK